MPVTRAQARTWARHHLEPTGRHNLAAAIRLSGALDVPRLVGSVESLTCRHEALRTSFLLVGDEPRRTVTPTAAHELLLIDARELPGEQARRREAAALRQPFDLESGPLWRAVLVRTQFAEWRLCLAIHPILADRRALHVLLHDLVELYREADVAGRRASGPDAAGAAREPEISLRALSYWQRQLEGWSPVSLAEEGQAQAPARGARYPFALPGSLVEALDALGTRHGLALDAILLAAFEILLARYSGQDDVGVATHATRQNPDQPEVTGALSTLLPVRVELAATASGLECLRRVADALSAARAQVCPYEDLADSLGLPAAPPVGFAYEERPALPALPDLEIELAEVDLAAAPLELALHLFRDGGRVTGHLEYDAGAFEPQRVARLADHFLRLTGALAGDPERPIGLLPLVGDQERDELLAWARGPATPPGPDVAINALFEAAVDRTPDAIAVAWDGGSFTYRELDRRANQLARHLVALGVGKDTPVCLHLDRSPELIVAVWGVLKAGGAYVPLDATYPPERLAHILRQTQAPLLLTQAALLPSVPAGRHRAICLDTDWPAISLAPDDRLGVAADPGQLAYVIFTSGSTGTPRGVMIEHRSLVHYTRAASAAYRVAAADRVLQFASISFDASVEEIFPTLTSGATLVLRGSSTLESAARFLAGCADQQISVLSLPTAYWHELVGALARGEARLPGSLRLIIIGGEQASAPALAEWQRCAPSRVQLLNTYGPTEATVVTTSWDAASATPDLVTVPIGRPLPGSIAYLLDPQLAPVPVGVAGELYIGGPAVARGYLGERALSEGRFIRDPFAGDPAARLYRTGDRCRVRAGGDLEFLGRNDHQLKLHGHRIELEEIEAHLRAYPGVIDASVIACADPRGDIRLAGYVAAGEAARPTADQLRRHLERWLVPHLIPPVAVLDRLPRTVNGKIDRRALPETAAGAGAAPPRDPARHPVEELVQQLFCEALGGEPVGIRDDFFAHGGDSLSALELITLVEARLRLDIPVETLYDHPTVEALTRALLSAVHGDSAPVTPHDLAAEARLDGVIRAPTGAPTAGPPHAALLTGATGFFGAFVLAELLAGTRETIHCIVRARSAGEAHRRLAASWERYFGGAELPADRVIAVPGDLGEARFGLSEAAFRELAERVDVVYHSAAEVNYLLPYRSLRAANVHGTEEVMRLATTGILKPVHHVSSISVLGAADCGAREGTPLGPARGLADGYSQSKWVAERLCEQARQNGVPITIYRPGRLTGHSLTGASNADDFLLALLQACVQLGAAPELDLEVDMVPVDFASAALVRLSLDPGRAGRVFHLGHPQPTSWYHLVAALAGYGYPLCALPFDSWLAAVKQTAAHRQGSRARLVSRFSRDQLIQALAAGYDCRATLLDLAAAGGAAPPVIDQPLLHAGFDFLVRAGLLPRPAGRT